MDQKRARSGFWYKGIKKGGKRLIKRRRLKRCSCIGFIVYGLWFVARNFEVQNNKQQTINYKLFLMQLQVISG